MRRVPPPFRPSVQPAESRTESDSALYGRTSPIHPYHSQGALNSTSTLTLPVVDNDEVARPSDTIANDVPQNANTILSETTSSIHERLDIPEEELSEEQLRALYDDEELDRFLNMFSAYVREVRSTDPHPVHERALGQDPLQPSTAEERMMMEDASASNVDWISPDDTNSKSKRDSIMQPSENVSLSQRIAKACVLYLPPPAGQPPRFTIGRSKEVVQRLYLSVAPIYGPFLARIGALATWKDWNASCFWCSVFWILWIQDLLLPALVLRILWSLFRRRFVRYPTLKELRQRRREVVEAQEFGDGLTSRLTRTSRFGVRDAWRAFQDLRSPSQANLSPIGVASPKSPEEVDADDARSLITPQEQAILSQILAGLGELADLHERIRNIFLWRKPASSRIYGMALSVIFLVVLMLPARVLARLVYATMGVMFWHITPILAAFSKADMSRLPPAFSDVPTDTDYAMQMMNERVRRGESLSSTMQRRKPQSRKPSGLDRTAFSSSTSQLGSPNDSSDDRKPWVKNMIGIAKTTQSVAQTGLKFAKEMRVNAVTTDETSPDVDMGSQDSHSYFAQHSSGPGFILVTSNLLRFILAAGSKHMTWSRSSIRGVKKTDGLGVKGLAIRWVNEDGDEKVEKFLWVKGRDEVFARLVTASDQRWLRV